MNQPTTTLSATRPSAMPEAPDIVSVLRRYAVLIVAGGVLGTVIAGGIWGVLRYTHPRYSASVTYQVLPPQVSLASKSDQLAPANDTQDEVSQFIRRRRLRSAGPGDLLKESAEPRGGDE